MSEEKEMKSDLRFKMAVEAIINNWTALQMGVDQNAAGPESKAIAAWIPNATVQWFSENKDLQPDEVEDFLLDIINQYFKDFLIQDGSAEETSKLVCKFYTLANNRSVDDDSFKTSLQALVPKCDLSGCKIAEHEDVEAMKNSEKQLNVDDDSFKPTSQVLVKVKISFLVKNSVTKLLELTFFCSVSDVRRRRNEEYFKLR